MYYSRRLLLIIDINPSIERVYELLWDGFPRLDDAGARVQKRDNRSSRRGRSSSSSRKVRASSSSIARGKVDSETNLQAHVEARLVAAHQDHDSHSNDR